MDPKLLAQLLLLARELEAILIKQAGQAFPGSKFSRSIRVIPVVKDDSISFKTLSSSIGKYLDKGTLGRRAKISLPFNPKPPRKGKAKNWIPSGIAPSFWKSIPVNELLRIKNKLNTIVKKWIKSQIPNQITMNVK